LSAVITEEKIMAQQVDFKIDWSGRAFDYSPEEIAVVTRVMTTADPMTKGKYLRQFEADFAHYNGSPHAFGVTSATNAIDLAAILSRVGPGDEVLIPAHTFCASAIPFGKTGAKIVWTDIDPATRVVSVESIKQRLTPRTKVIVVVHLYGLMAEMDPIMELARSHNCLVLEDCAQAIGAAYKGRKAGSIGDFGAFSFHCQKNLTTLGEGGVLTLRSEELAEKVPGLRHNGCRPFDYEREDYWIPAMGNVDLDLEGVWPHNFPLAEVQAALASKLLERVDRMNDDRIARAKTFRAAVAGYPELSFQQVSPDHRHVYHLLSAKYDGRAYGKNNHDFLRIMAYEHKIKAIVQYYPLYRYPLFQKMGFGQADCPHVDQFFDNMISFPFQHWMSDQDFSYLMDCTVDTLKRLRG
jgi:dTDP-4-amino-4,6-dideoxygalactose transaminase